MPTNLFITRAYNTIKLNPQKQTITKTSKEDRLYDEINFYQNIPNDLKVYFPRLVSFSSVNNSYEMELEYYPFDNLGVSLIENKFTEEHWIAVAKSFKNILELFQQKKLYQSIENLNEYRCNMFMKKTEKEYNNLINNFEYFKELSKYDNIIVNDVKYQNFHLIWDKLKQFIENEYCTNEQFSFIQGDLCFSNILCQFDKHHNPIIKLLDPRGSFGIKGCYGDSIYDPAKLLHSLNGKYEYVIYDKFNLTSTNNTIQFSFVNNEQCEKVLKIFQNELFYKQNYLKIRIIEGLIYVGMCARHGDSLDRQKIMFFSGIKFLNECLKEIK